MRGCQLCVGGWRIVETAESSYARRCECWVESERTRRLERAGIPTGLRHCDLASFDPIHPQHRTALRVVRDFVETFPITEGTGLLLHGPAGTGKTHLAVAIVAELVGRWRADARFLDFRSLLKVIQESWNPVAEASEKEVLDDVLGCDLVALDDLGAEKSSAWVRETVGYLINERYVRGKPVVITTNLRYDSQLARGDARSDAARRGVTRRVGHEPTGQVDSLADRIGAAALSRLFEMCKPVDLTEVEDYRRTVKLYGTDKKFRRG